MKYTSPANRRGFSVAGGPLRFDNGNTPQHHEPPQAPTFTLNTPAGVHQRMFP